MNEYNRKSILLNIKSNYILGQILDNLYENKLLNIIRYNKFLQNKLNKDIISYQEATKIVIEIIPGENFYGKFINIPYKKENFFHIYFNDNKEEIKRDHFTFEDNKPKKVKVIIDRGIVSLRSLFYYCKNENINFIKFNRKDINDMSYMFYKCDKLKELNINKMKTNNVTKMICMFGECKLLKKLNLFNFNTNNVTHMSNMFKTIRKRKENPVEEKTGNENRKAKLNYDKLIFKNIEKKSKKFE